MMSFQRGCVVRSTAGRDKGRLLAVTAVTQRGVEVCDGKERKLLRPKIKNPKHVEPTPMRLTQEDMRLTAACAARSEGLRMRLHHCREVSICQSRI